MAKQCDILLRTQERGGRKHQARVNLDVLRLDMTVPWPAVVPDFIGLALTPYTLNVIQLLCIGFLGDESLMYTRGGVRSMTGLGLRGDVCNNDTAPE